MPIDDDSSGSSNERSCGSDTMLSMRAINLKITYRKKEYMGPYIGCEEDGP